VHCACVCAYSTAINCIIADHVTNRLRTITFKRSEFELPSNVKLADPQFHVSHADIDLLIGAKFFWDLICIGQIKTSGKHPISQKTKLVWILAEPLTDTNQSSVKVNSLHAIGCTNEQLHNQLTQFWLVEDTRELPHNYTAEERLCEQHFLNNVRQTFEGRYVVKLPIKEDVVVARRFSKHRIKAIDEFRTTFQA